MTELRGSACQNARDTSLTTKFRSQGSNRKPGMATHACGSRAGELRGVETRGSLAAGLTQGQRENTSQQSRGMQQDICSPPLASAYSIGTCASPTHTHHTC